jgi:hypothetical protein
MGAKSATRIAGAFYILIGGVGVILALWLPGKLASALTTCNTVLGKLASEQDPGTDLKCTAAEFAHSYVWIIGVLGALSVIYGLFALIWADDPAVRDDVGTE